MPEIELTCSHCSQLIGVPPVLNDMADGEACPVCRDRVLEAQTPIFHGSATATAAISLVGGAARAPEEASHLRLVEDGPDQEFPA